MRDIPWRQLIPLFCYFIVTVTSLIPLTLILRNGRAGYDLRQVKGVMNSFLYVDNLKVYGKRREPGRHICPGHKSGEQWHVHGVWNSWECAVLIMKRGKLLTVMTLIFQIVKQSDNYIYCIYTAYPYCIYIYIYIYKAGSRRKRDAESRGLCKR